MFGSGVNIFRHLYAKRRVSFAFAVRNSESPCFAHFIHYLRYRFGRHIVKNFGAVHEISDLFDDTLCAIRAIVDFVERNEPSSDYIP